MSLRASNHSSWLKQLSALPADWDGQGAFAISSTVTELARAILAELETIGVEPELILPSAAGTVLFEWDTPFGSASLEIGRNTFSFYMSPNVGEPVLYGGQFGVWNATNVWAALAAISPAATLNGHNGASRQ